MALIRFHPKDQAKYGIDGPITFVLSEVGIRQKAAFEKQTKRSLNWLYNQLSGVPELDEHGNAIPEPAYNGDGTPKLNEDGTQVVRVKLTRDPESLAMFAWLALWGVGVKVPWDDFEVIESGLRIGPGEDEDDTEVEDEGKAQTDSASTTSPTEQSPTA